MKRIAAMLLCAALTLSLCAGGAYALPLPGAVAGFCSQEEWDVLAETNRERLGEGMEPYSTFPHLQTAARVRSGELETLFEHVRPNGSSWATAVTEAGLGYTIAGENIAAGYGDARQVVTAWMASPDHRSNILDGSYAHMGVGFATGQSYYSTFWAQTFLYKGCSVSDLFLSQDSVSCPAGTGLEELGVYLIAVCPFHGPCYLPLVEELCTGFDSQTPGRQEITVSCYGRAVQLQVEVAPPPLDTTGADGWAVNFLLQADQLGLLSSRNRTNFTANVTRLQFADLAVSLAEAFTGIPIEPAPEGTFTDTEEECVRKASAAGLASGYPGGIFCPDKNITRQELCVLLTHVVKYAEDQLGRTLLPWEQAFIAGTFPDAGKVDSWALDGVGLMTGTGLMAGRGGWIMPQASTQLQEAAALAVKLYDAMLQAPVPAPDTTPDTPDSSEAPETPDTPETLDTPVPDMPQP